MCMYTSSKEKENAFITKLNPRCFCSFPAAILVYIWCTPIWRLHTKFYKVAKLHSETAYHTDLRLGGSSFCISLLYHFIFLASFIERFYIYFFMAWQWERFIGRVGGGQGWRQEDVKRLIYFFIPTYDTFDCLVHTIRRYLKGKQSPQQGKLS